MNLCAVRSQPMYSNIPPQMKRGGLPVNHCGVSLEMGSRHRKKETTFSEAEFTNNFVEVSGHNLESSQT